MTPTRSETAALVSAWVFEVDPREVDLVDAFADGEAIAHFEVADDDRLGLLGPGQPAHLWVADREGGSVAAGIYATGSVVGPVEWVEDDDDRYPTVPVGLSPLRQPIGADVLLADEAFDGSPLHDGSPDDNPTPLTPAQAEAVTAHPLDEGSLSSAVTAAGDDLVVLPALEVRLPDDTLLVVPADDHDGYTVVRGTPDLDEVQELPDQHRTFIDAVEYVAAVAEQVAGEVPVSADGDAPEAVAIFDADGGLYVVVKRAADAYDFVWADDDGSLDTVDGYASLREAILLPVLDEELFGDR